MSAIVGEDQISYSWDRLIESFFKHLFAGTSYYLTEANLAEQEKGFRFLARENRTRRRMLSEALNGLIAKTPKNMRATRTGLPSSPGDPYYIFLVLPEPDYTEYAKYREVRLELLNKYCLITKLNHPAANDIIGIATETGSNDKRSEDFAYFDARNWTEEDNKLAQNT